jgi:hypothetical protein
MTTLFGNDTFTNPATAQSMGGRGGFEYFLAGYTGVVGTATRLGTYVVDWSGRTALKGVVFNASGVPIDYAIWLPAQGTGVIFANLNSGFTSSIQTYRLGMREQTDNYLSIAFGGGSFEGEYAAGGSYAAPPTINAGSETFWSGGEFAIWVDGTLGAGTKHLRNKLTSLGVGA